MRKALFRTIAFFLLCLPCLGFSKSEEAQSAQLDKKFGDHRPYKEFFYRLKRVISEEDRQALSQMIFYPLEVLDLQEDKKIERDIHSPEEFLAEYDTIVTEKIKHIIKNATYEDLGGSSRYPSIKFARSKLEDGKYVPREKFVSIAGGAVIFNQPPEAGSKVKIRVINQNVKELYLLSFLNDLALYRKAFHKIQKAFQDKDMDALWKLMWYPQAHYCHAARKCLKIKNKEHFMELKPDLMKKKIRDAILKQKFENLRTSRCGANIPKILCFGEYNRDEGVLISTIHLEWAPLGPPPK